MIHLSAPPSGQGVDWLCMAAVGEAHFPGRWNKLGSCGGPPEHPVLCSPGGPEVKGKEEVGELTSARMAWGGIWCWTDGLKVWAPSRIVEEVPTIETRPVQKVGGGHPQAFTVTSQVLWEREALLHGGLSATLLGNSPVTCVGGTPRGFGKGFPWTLLAHRAHPSLGPTSAYESI